MPSEAVIGRWKETVRELGNILVQVSSSVASAPEMPAMRSCLPFE